MEPAPQASITPRVRLGNSSYSGDVYFTYYNPAQPPPSPRPNPGGSHENPFPPIHNGEATELLLMTDKAAYVWGQVSTLTATLRFKRDKTPLPSRIVVVVVNSNVFPGGTVNFIARTNGAGVATLHFVPFGVPGSGGPDIAAYRAFAAFMGY